MSDGTEQGLIAPHGGSLNPREVTGEQARSLEERARTLPQRALNSRELSDLELLANGGFSPLDGDTPIVPIIVGDTADAIRMSELLLDEGIFVTGFGFPVVPVGTARLRCQISAAHTRDDLDYAVRAIKKVGLSAGVLK